MNIKKEDVDARKLIFKGPGPRWIYLSPSTCQEIRKTVPSSAQSLVHYFPPFLFPFNAN